MQLLLGTAVGPVPVILHAVTFQGTITAGILKGPLAGQPLAALTALFKAGNAYVSPKLPCTSDCSSTSTSSRDRRAS